MTYLIRESNQNDKNLINDFNKELENQGFNIRLPTPHSENLNINNLIFQNSFILIENKITVRAGYTLKSQWFKVNDKLLQVGYYYRPVSAGLFNKKYNICGVLLLNNAQKGEDCEWNFQGDGGTHDQFVTFRILNKKGEIHSVRSSSFSNLPLEVTEDDEEEYIQDIKNVAENFFNEMTGG